MFCQCKHFSNWRISLEKLISFIKAGTFFEIRNNFSQNGNIFWNSKRKLVKRKHSLNSRPKFENTNIYLKFVNVFKREHFWKLQKMKTWTIFKICKHFLIRNIFWNVVQVLRSCEFFWAKTFGTFFEKTQTIVLIREHFWNYK